MRPYRTVLLVVTGVAFCLAHADVEPSDADWRWLADADRVIDSIMPIDAVDRTALVTFRSQPSLDSYVPDDDQYDVPEQYFAIRQVLPDGLPPWTLVATLIEPKGRPLKTQLFMLHFMNPSATPEALLPKLAVTKSQIMEKECPELRSHIGKLAKLRITVPPLNKVAVDPIVRDITIRTGMGDIHAVLFDHADPLVTWALKTLDTLSLCAKRSGNGKP